MTTKKLVPLLIALLGFILVIAALLVWLEPPKDGGLFTVVGGIISFLAGLGVSLKGWKDLFKKDNDEKSIQTQNQTQTVNINIAPLTSPSQITNHQSSKDSLPNLPFFFGRDKELQQIYEALKPEIRNWGVMITGPGGIGKTALAIRGAEKAPEELFEQKIFISAKIRKLTPNGEVELVDFSQPSYLGMLSELARQIGTEETMSQSNTNSVNDLRNYLINQKNLIIFDNLETLPVMERNRLYQFLSNLPKHNKAIVTSRRYPSDPDVRIIPLGYLSYEDSMDLLIEYKKNYHRLQTVRYEDLSDLCKITNGNPCLINWIVGQLGNENSGCYTIKDAYQLLKADPFNNPLEYIFGDLLDNMTGKELAVLDALSWFEKPAKTEWISDMTEIPHNELELIFHDLAERSIIVSNSEATLFALPTLAREYIKQQNLNVQAEEE